MGQRISYGTASILLLVLIFMTDVEVAQRFSGTDGLVASLLARGSILPLFVMVLMLAGAVEMKQLLLASGARPFASFAYAMIALGILCPWLSAAEWLGSGPAQVEGLYWMVVWIIVSVVGTGALCVWRGQVDGSLRDLGATALMIGYLGFLPSFALQLRCGRDVPGQLGVSILLMTVLVVKASDIGAYFVGSTIGRSKLAATISPNKSIEGAVGGILASIVLAISFAYAEEMVRWIGVSNTPASPLSVPRFFGPPDPINPLSVLFRAIVFGASMSVLGQIGDLLESCFKRDADIKDSGSILPTFGGILDLIDSPVLALPVAWFLLTAIWGVV